MAKPDKPCLAGPSCSAQNSRRHKRTRHAPPSHLFTLFATICASSNYTHAHPLDHPRPELPFLYPPSVLPPTPRSDPLPPSDATTSPPPQTPPLACRQERPNLPDKYVLGDDGLWHKTEWSLYGSTNCPGSCSSSSALAPSSVPTPQNDVDAQASTTTGAVASTSTSVDEFDPSSLPAGWTTPDAASRRFTVVIIALSVALAVIIVVMMTTCVFWRRKHQPKRDPEKRLRSQQSMPSSSDFADDAGARSSLRNAKVAQTKWVRTAIRWREKIPTRIRRRRKDRALAQTVSYAAIVQEEEEREGAESDVGDSRPSSRAPSPAATLRSRTPSSASTHRGRDVPTASSAASIRSVGSHAPSEALPLPPPSPVPLPPPTPPPPPPPSQPPAYHLRPRDVDADGGESPEYSYADAPVAGPSKPRLPSPEPDAGPRASLTGHVATDDKAILSRRAALASAPSEPPPAAPAHVPSLDDDDGLDFDSEAFPPYAPPALPLPAPPAKGKLRYDYAHELALEIADVEPEMGPSAPPFEERAAGAGPSAPPLLEDGLAPSAPALEDGLGPSAPPLEEPEDDGRSPALEGHEGASLAQGSA
ncbi:hypothetical protein BC834DRAFT_851997 [Gloeopeniophorella convolvens]|nr:hypothetical protein BC834DRAFT_851997 [Gloeopeniophorella convolvens]